MSVAINENEYITMLLNSTLASIKNIIPIKYTIDKPMLASNHLFGPFGVRIGVTGDVKGELVLAGESSVFGSIGEKMFGMPLEGEMLTSFSGELGNMIAGKISMNLMNEGVRTDISTPTILTKVTALISANQIIRLPITLEETGNMEVFLKVSKSK